jgi:putative transposase
LFAVVMEAYLHWVSTRKVDDLAQALGADSGISKSEVSRICGDLDAEVSAFRDRSLAGQRFPYVFVDATYGKPGSTAASWPKPWWSLQEPAATAAARSWASPLATPRMAFWTAFLRSLKARGLAGVQLVIADAHLGLRQTVSAVMAGAAIQRCRVHFPQKRARPNPQGLGRDGGGGDPDHLRSARRRPVHEQLRTIAGMLGR